MLSIAMNQFHFVKKIILSDGNMNCYEIVAIR